MNLLPWIWFIEFLFFKVKFINSFIISMVLFTPAMDLHESKPVSRPLRGSKVYCLLS